MPAVDVSFEHSSYSVTEGEKTETVKVTLSAEPERTVDITADPDEPGGVGRRLLALGDQRHLRSHGDGARPSPSRLSHDSEDDDGESVKLTFGSALPAGVSRGSVPETVVSINDDDDPVVTVSFEHSTYSVAESDDASTTSEKENEVTVTVTLSAEPERTVDITLVPTNQGDTSNSDYSLSETSVTFGPTETEQTFTFTADDDAEDDDGESVKLTFGSALPAGVSRGSVPETTVSINDDDVPVVDVSFEHSSYSVAEGETETVKVTLSAEPERTVDITLVPTNQGASDDDYSLSETSLTFGPTETEQDLHLHG